MKSKQGSEKTLELLQLEFGAKDAPKPHLQASTIVAERNRNMVEVGKKIEALKRARVRRGPANT
jgi:hypothetical protein